MYWTNSIKSNSDDPKKLWRSMSSVLRRYGATTVPPSLDVTAPRLAQFFTDKVDEVRAATENAPPPSFSLYSGTQLTSFEDVTAEEVWKYILGSHIKTCVLDLLPTTVLREVVDDRSTGPCVTHRFNRAACHHHKKQLS